MNQQNEIIIELCSVTSGYRRRSVLDDVSLSVSRDDRIALIGANGCGKSTLLRTILNMVDSGSGEINLNGKLINNMRPDKIAQLGVGYLRQTDNVFQQMTVRDNLLVASTTGRIDNERADAVLGCFPQVTDQMQTRAGLLSGGQRQSLAVAMVLLRPVDLLLLDEPISGLSPTAAESLMVSLTKLQTQFTFASMVVEHRLRRLQPFVNRLLVMRNGRVIDDTRETTRMLDAEWLDQRYHNHGKNNAQ